MSPFQLRLPPAAGLVLGIVLLSGIEARPGRAQASPADVQFIMGLEDSLWATSRDHRADAFATYLAPGYRGVYPDGIHDRARELATFTEVNIRSYQLSDLIVRPLGPGLYAVTYRATVRGNYRGYDLRGDYWCSTVWQGSKASWQAILHTETKAPQK